MLKKRVIPVVLIDNSGKVIKTENFKNPNYIGDVFNTIKILNEYEVDEIILLDIEATKKKLKPNFDLLKKLSTEIFVPLSYGGGIDNLESIEKILSLGFEKVSINNASKNKNFINQACKTFGDQSIILSVDLMCNDELSIFDYVNETLKKISLEELIKNINDLKCGEFLFNFVEREGLMNGYNIRIIKNLISYINKPLIFCGGAGKLAHLEEVLSLGNCSVACGSFFIYANKNKGVLINYLDNDDKDSLSLKILNK